MQLSVFSVDDKAKVRERITVKHIVMSIVLFSPQYNLGVPAQNRLTKLQFFPVDDAPNFEDHDHPSGKKICPSGYMLRKPLVAGASWKRGQAKRRRMAEEVNVTLDEEEDDEEDKKSDVSSPGIEEGDLEEENKEKDKMLEFNVARIATRFEISDEESEGEKEERTNDMISNSDENDYEGIEKEHEGREAEENDEQEKLTPDKETNKDKVVYVTDNLGRKHVAFGHSGRTYVFYHSRPSTIGLHLSNIDSIIESLSQSDLSNMKVLILTADDGNDWSLRSNITDHMLCLLWLKYDLDAVIIVKNAPSDSRFNLSISPSLYLYLYFLSLPLSGTIRLNTSGATLQVYTRGWSSRTLWLICMTEELRRKRTILF